ncbi:MAG: GNAT family N-acetyltransferase [Actinobacteria bacterium]|nr:MAG: GNAT family N-acetyltransferase [Actinomycetota bacterium]
MIKKLAPKDVTQITALINEACREVYQNYAVSQFREDQIYDASGMDIYGYHEDDSLIGVMALQYIDEDLCLIRHAYVLPENQRQGIGQKLLSHLIDIAKKENKKKLLVGTYADNHLAVSFYEKNGFTKTTNSQELLAKYWSQVSKPHRQESLVLRAYCFNL